MITIYFIGFIATMMFILATSGGFKNAILGAIFWPLVLASFIALLRSGRGK